MRRFRIKLVGFGFAVLAGSAIGADGDWQPPGAPKNHDSNTVTPAGGQPALLPAAIRFNPAAASAGSMNPIWFSAARPPSSSPPAPLTLTDPKVKSAAGQVGPTPPGAGPDCHCDSPGSTCEIPRDLLTLPMPMAATPALIPEVRASQPLAVRFLMPWLQSLPDVALWPLTGPRIGIVPPSPLPDVSELPSIVVAPPAPSRPDPEPVRPTLTIPDASKGPPANPPMPSPSIEAMLPIPQPLPQPQPVQQQQPLPQPQPRPTSTPPAELPPPRPLAAVTPPLIIPMIPPTAVPGDPAACELPTAPPELMVPAGAQVPGKRGTFGSDSIRLSRDYPSLGDLCGTPLRDWIDERLANTPSGLDRGFVQAEYLLWWARGLNIPVLATTSTDPTASGFLGQPGTVPLLGPGTFLGSSRQGVRVRAGTWLDDCNTWGIDGSIFVLGQKSASATIASNQYPLITRPVFSPNPIPGTGTVIGETGELVAVPGILAGVLSVHAESFLWGADANLRRCLFSDCNTRASWFVGYRNLNLIESLSIREDIVVIGPGGTRLPGVDPIGTLITVQDRFATTNHFNGGQIGGTYERRWGRFDLDARASIALGDTHQELDVTGSQTRERPGQPTATFRGGLLAAGPNLGTFTSDRFSVVPELTLNAGYWVLPNLKMYVGYNFLYWSNVIRPGDQIDRVVDLTFVPNGPAVAASGQLRPQPLFKQSDLWVNGMQFGVEWRW